VFVLSGGNIIVFAETIALRNRTLCVRIGGAVKNGFIFRASGTQAAIAFDQNDLYEGFIPGFCGQLDFFAVAFASSSCIL